MFLSMLMILLSTLSVIGFRICGNGYSWPLNLNLTFGKLVLGRKGRADFSVRETQLLSFLTFRIFAVLLIGKPKGLSFM